MTNDIKDMVKKRMQKCVTALQNELTRIRTGRAHTNLLEHVMVEYYGNDTPLNQVASITVSDPRTLSVTPWEKTMLAKIEKAIAQADLGLNPSVVGVSILVPVPPLTEERRKDMIRTARGEAENARNAVRNIRREANKQLKEQLKAKEISEDEEHALQEAIQRLTDQFVEELGELLHAKEADLSEV